jgi:hypothetical protein
VTAKKPGWSLALPFDLDSASEDLRAAALLIARLSRAAGSSTGEDAEGLAAAQQAVARIGARIARHVGN